MLNSKTLVLFVELQWRQICRERLLTTLLYRLMGIAGLMYVSLFGCVAGFYIRHNGAITFETLLVAATGMDFISKFILKKRSLLNIKPFLTLPVSKNSLIIWALAREFFAVRNLYLLFFIIPAALTGGVVLSLFQWLLAVFSAYLTSLSGSLTVNIFRLSKSAKSIIFLTLALAAIVCVFYLTDYKAITLFQSVLPVVAVVAFLLCVANKLLMKRSIYHIEEQIEKPSAMYVRLPVFMRNNLTVMHLLQTVRCKRLRGMLLSSIFLIATGLHLLLNEQYASRFIVSQFALWIYLGSFGIVPAQCILAFESTYFDGLQTKPLPLHRIIRNRYRIYVAVTSTMFLTVLPVCIYRNIPLLAPTASFFFVIGLVYGLLFVNMLFARSRFDLFATAWGNRKGFSFMQNIISMSAFFLPLSVIGIGSVFLSETTIYLIMIVFGATVFGLHSYWIKLLCRMFEKRKYKSMEGFRM